MAMTKVEMEHHQKQYQSLMADARSAEQAGLYRIAIEKALASWEHIDGMMQYERRYESKEFRSVPAIDLTLRYAPLLLDFASLDALEGLLKDCRRIEKNTSDSLVDKLAAARALMREAHRLWDHLEWNPRSRQDELRRLLGGDQEQWRGIAEAWDKMGLLRRESEGGTYRLSLSTRMGEVVLAKCPGCGNIVEAPKAMCLEDMVCPECEATTLFVILSAPPLGDPKE
jgi:hypothetical protein